MAQEASVSATEIEIEERVDLAPLSSLINAALYSRAPTPQSVFTDGRLLALCEAYSIFSQCGLAENVTCRECEEPHTAAVFLDHGRFFYRCLFNGRIDLNRHRHPRRDRVQSRTQAAAGEYGRENAVGELAQLVHPALGVV